MFIYYNIIILCREFSINLHKTNSTLWKFYYSKSKSIPGSVCILLLTWYILGEVLTMSIQTLYNTKQCQQQTLWRKYLWYFPWKIKLIFSSTVISAILVGYKVVRVVYGKLIGSSCDTLQQIKSDNNRSR